ncbi:MAG: bifunctional diaminohydroxyphosphoribosylaminopyrimidine deaminase/5-amino-6-(5-phosphoribosylamino)uracil reductase RibD [Lewinellaceae bacterium]|nr:bifunctional diaminohydroxyphosphoribosylaminopyrimidine deaminase/5-amino-6-(5-phosphoribosylamino)uracil reductase RibD [Lewinellaceae bacterium]
MASSDRHFMQRCFDLAVLGAGRTAPNPMVGAVLVHNETIIGEGFHRAYGEAHAEVNAVNSVSPENRNLVPYSTLYVSLEPCNIYGKTPPCTNLILEKKIPKVVISCLDHSPGVNGSGIERLRAAGVEVVVGVLEAEGQHLSRIRNTFVRENRPYIILKFAQSSNGMFAPPDSRQYWLTNAFSKRLTHKWRSEVDAILVGANTARIDNPQLTNRLWPGKSPLRVVLSRHGGLPSSLALFDENAPTLLVCEKKTSLMGQKNYQVLELAFNQALLPSLLTSLAQRNITSLLVEGGARTLEGFLQLGLWDEARVLVAGVHLFPGLPAPQLPLAPESIQKLGNDFLLAYQNHA